MFPPENPLDLGSGGPFFANSGEKGFKVRRGERLGVEKPSGEQEQEEEKE